MTRGRFRLLVGAAVAAGCLAVGGSIAGATPASAQLCIPIILPCSTPSPAQTPAPTPSPGAPASTPGSADGGASNGGTTAGASNGDAQRGGDSPTPHSTTVPNTTKPQPKLSAAAIALLPKDDSMVFTQPSAQLGVSSLSFTGLKGFALVTVRLADGTRIPVLRLRADGITMDGFALTVRKATGPMLVTKADRMALKGDVTVYLNSVTATDSKGRSLTLGADTPPPKDGITPKLLRVTLGLVGTRADQIVYTNTDQQLKG